MTSRPALAEQFDLQPHPEGGWFRETFRSSVEVHPPGYDGPRAAATAILFLLCPGERSAWHVVKSDELWLWHFGGPLELHAGGTGDHPAGTAGSGRGAHPGGAAGSGAGDATGVTVLGITNPQALVPAGVWQAAVPAGQDPVLVSCVVSPGFDFADFRME